MAVGKDIWPSVWPSAKIIAQTNLRIPQERFAPDAIGAIDQEVGKFTNFKRADQTMGAYSKEFDVLREEAEAWGPIHDLANDDMALRRELITA